MSKRFYQSGSSRVAGKWPAGKTWQSYDEQDPICGCNYLPRTAINSTEMWQDDTFDPDTIGQELGWAHEAGINSIRVFIQFLVWQNDRQGLIQRVDHLLTIAHQHQISVMLTLFDDCAFAGIEPHLVLQPHLVRQNGGSRPVRNL